MILYELLYAAPFRLGSNRTRQTFNISKMFPRFGVRYFLTGISKSRTSIPGTSKIVVLERSRIMNPIQPFLKRGSFSFEPTFTTTADYSIDNLRNIVLQNMSAQSINIDSKKVPHLKLLGKSASVPPGEDQFMAQVVNPFPQPLHLPCVERVSDPSVIVVTCCRPAIKRCSKGSDRSATGTALVCAAAGGSCTALHLYHMILIFDT